MGVALVDEFVTLWAPVGVPEVLDDAWPAEGVEALCHSGGVDEVAMADLVKVKDM